MPIFRERTDLDKKPTWYLFLAANVLVLLGCAITFALYYNDTFNKDTGVQYVPTIVCNLVALVAAGFFIWLEAKGIMNKVMHFRKKWLKFYLAALIVFVSAVIYTFVFNFVFRHFYFQDPDKYKDVLIADIVVAGVLTLVSIGLQRYARFKIDLDMYRRTHGEVPKAEEDAKEETKKQEVKSEQSSSSQATSGLTDSITKQ